jgi:hypothetical protein
MFGSWHVSRRLYHEPGVVDDIFVGLGYEIMPIPYFGVQVTMNAGLSYGLLVGASLSFNAHLSGKSFVDPYLGICFESMISAIDDGSLLSDVGFLLGINLMIARSFGIKLQGKTFPFTGNDILF